DLDWLADERDERRAVGERAVGVAVDEVRREVGVEPADVRLPYRADVVMVEFVQRRAVRRARHTRDDVGRLRRAGLRRRGPKREVRRDALPAPVDEAVDVGVVSQAVLAVRSRVPVSRIDDAEVADDSRAGVDGGHVLARIRPADPLEESGAVDQRAVGVARHETRRQVLVEPADVRSLTGSDVATIELLERLHVLPRRVPSSDHLSRISCARFWSVKRSSFKMLLLDLRKSDGPLYRRVYLALKSMIRDGRLAPAARLPSTRELAADLQVSRNTVV